MNQDSIRVTETKIRIRDAFFELYGTKKIEKISIKEITDNSQLNRGTFYVYYKDIYDLLEKAEDELIAELIVKIKEIVPRIIRDENIEQYLPTPDFYQCYGKFLGVLLGENGDPKFIHKLKTILKRTLKYLLKQEDIPDFEKMEYVLEYIASAQVGMISLWLKNDMALPINELGNLIKTLTLRGPLGYLKMQDVSH